MSSVQRALVLKVLMTLLFSFRQNNGIGVPTNSKVAFFWSFILNSWQ